MNSMLIIASLIAVAVASPAHYRLGASTNSVPASILGPATFTPVPVGPANTGFTPNIVGPVLTDNIGDNKIDSVQVILVINNYIHELNVPASVATPVLPSPVVIDAPEVVIPGAVNIVDGADAPIVPSPVIIGNPEAGAVNIVDGAEVIPSPAVILPEILN